MTLPVRLVVGLGNPGAEYEDTRHNAGFWFVDSLAEQYRAQFKVESKFSGQACRIRVDGEECWLLKPATFMNRSGQSVSGLAKYFKIPLQQILVVHDELDLPAGAVRLKKGGGAGGHNGLRDIMSAMGSRDFHRLRIGIDEPERRGPGVDFVLGRPGKAAREAIMDGIDRAIDCLDEILDGRLQQAMNRLHTRR